MSIYLEINSKKMNKNTVVQAAWGSYVAKTHPKVLKGASSHKGYTNQSRQELRDALASALMQKVA